MDDHHTEPNERNFPSNSIRGKSLNEENSIEPAARSKMDKVITGKVMRRKKSFLDKIGEALLGDDTQSVGSYILWDVLIPAAKNTISEMVSTGIEMILFGEARGSSTRRDKGRSYVSYNTIRDRGRDRDRSDPGRSRVTHKFDDIVIPSRGEAEEVLSNMVECIDNYDQVTIADYYDLVGVTSVYSDNRYGWTNLNRATVNRVRDGYILDLPKPIVLD